MLLPREKHPDNKKRILENELKYFNLMQENSSHDFKIIIDLLKSEIKKIK